MMLASIIVIVTVAATYGTRSQWIGHAVTAIVGFSLLVMVLLTGAIQRGHIFREKNFHVYPLHRAAGLWFGIVVTATFVLGLLLTMRYGQPVLRSVHGILGLTLTVLAIIQIVPSLVITKRMSIRIIHRIIGYLIVVLFSIQIFFGLSVAGIFS